MSILQYFSIVFNARVILFTRSVALLVWLCMCVSMHACVYVGVKEKVWPVSVQQGSTRLRWKLLLHYPVKFFPHYNLFANFQLYTFFFYLFFLFFYKKISARVASIELQNLMFLWTINLDCISDRVFTFVQNISLWFLNVLHWVLLCCLSFS